jgi:hypothetical protein
MPNPTPDSRREDVTPSNETLRRPAPNVIDQRQQQIDPAGSQRRDDNDRPDANRKQPGGSVSTFRDQKDPAP